MAGALLQIPGRNERGINLHSDNYQQQAIRISFIGQVSNGRGWYSAQKPDTDESAFGDVVSALPGGDRRDQIAPVRYMRKMGKHGRASGELVEARGLRQ
jgi:hypothetical protein